MYLIIGWGRTGQGSAKFLHDNHIKYVIYDDKTHGDNIFNNPNDLPWNTIDKAILSPGVPTWDQLPLIVILCRQKGIPIFSDMDILYHYHSCKNFIGITGSQGKTTIHDFISKFMDYNNYSISSGGNNGVPCLSLGNSDHFILETSMQQLLINQSILYNIGIFNNFFDTHQEMGDYFFRLNTKKKILIRGKNLNQRFIVGDFPKSITKYFYHDIKNEDIIVYSYNFHSIDDINHKNYCYVDYKNNCHQVEFSIDGQKNQWIFPSGLGFKLIAEENLGIIVAFIIIMGHNQEDLLKFLNNYTLVDHRLSLVKSNVINDYQWQWFNGSKCTNTFALTSLIKYVEYNFPGFNYWILGGVINSPLDPLGNINKKDKFIAYGQGGQSIYEYLKLLGYDGILVNNLSEAVHIIQENIKDYDHGGNIILAPACQSFDQFKDFEHRGRYFSELIGL